MIIYGDPNYQANIGALLAQLTAAVEKTGLESDLDNLRYLLILAGQAEQAVYDNLPGRLSLAEAGPWLQAFRHLTALAAAAFYKFWQSQENGAEPALTLPELALIKAVLAELQSQPSLETALTVKVPEGYAFYALYPEQYCFAVRRWLGAHETVAKEVVAVIGIRSIGTSLAALVCAALHEAGWPSHSFTVRPGGHPFRRELEIEPELLKEAAFAIVVDEGPGQSGSSMASVAFALEKRGFQPDHIAFMPGHPNEPGQAASAEVRACWQRIPRYVLPSSELTLAGLSLPALLAENAGQLLHTRQAVHFEDIGWGKWRSRVFGSPVEWPPVYPAFELPKYLASTLDGPVLVWKFYGLCAFSLEGGSAAERAFTRLKERAEAGFGPVPLDYTQGFVAYQWVDGVPLAVKDAGKTVLTPLAHYIAAVAGPPLKAAELAPASERLREMLYWNTWEILGEAAAEITRGLALTAENLTLNSYGDGHMAPHEWLRTPAGGLVKVNGAGLATDHTCAGPQPVYWDLAGVIVEWQLSGKNQNFFLEAYEKISGKFVQPDALTFYCAAYTAFKAAKVHLAASQTNDGPEQKRLWAEFDFLKTRLAGYLAL